SNWDELRRATEQIETLTTLVGQFDNEEIRELRRIRDRSKVLEGEHSALQRRMKEYENKAASHEKIVQTSRQSLLQARQRAEEWEKRAKEAESGRQKVQMQLDEAEQTISRVETEFALAKLHLDERDNEERSDKERQSQMLDQIATLEAQVARLQAEVDKAKKSSTVLQPQPVARYQNGKTHPLPRPDSRASTIYDRSRAGTPKAQHNGTTNDVRVATPPQPSVRDSIHAPWKQPAAIPTFTPKSRYNTPPNWRGFRAPSPSPSVVSAVPTQGEDGWWS
ncbi:hypothetical protein C8T65DRAFT_748567, partial [Cerioporus squamosus]